MEKFTNSLFCKGLIPMLLVAFLSIPVFGQGFSEETKARLQDVLNSFQNDPANPFIGGMSVTIKIDELAKWSGASGYASRNVNEQNQLQPGGTPFTTTTTTRIYSITKTFTSSLVLQLAQEGRLSLDDEIGKYIPLSTINPDLSNDVTIRQLLAHRSGFSDYVNEPLFQFYVALNPAKIWTPVEIVSFARKISEPGTEDRYSSTNYIILGALIELVTGSPVATLFRERFFKPLNLNSTYLAVFESQAQNGKSLEASPHDNLSPYNPLFSMIGRPTFPYGYTNVSAFDFTGIASAAFTGGGIVSTSDDIAEWGSALFSGEANGKKITKQMMESISDTPEEDGDYLGYGIFGNYKISDTEMFVMHNGLAPGYRTLMFHQPDKKVTIAVLTNFAGANAYAIARELYAVIAELYDGDKIYLCAKGKTLSVSLNAAPAHIAKGATLGRCEGESVAADAGIMEKRHAATPAIMQLKTYPNPSKDQFSFTFSLDNSGTVSFQIVNVQGDILATLYQGQAIAGEEKTVVWKPAHSLPAGIYIGRLSTSEGVENQRVIFTR